MNGYKNFLWVLPLILLMSIGASCDPQSLRRNSNLLDKQQAKVDKVEDKIADNTTGKLQTVATYAAGTDYALTSSTNKVVGTVVAKQMNDRVVSIAGAPNIKDLIEIQTIADMLLSTNSVIKAQGNELLRKRDGIIVNLQLENTRLREEKDKEIDKLSVVAEGIAKKADQTAQELNEYKGWFGLKAIAMGLKSLVKTFIWVIVIGGIVFLLLRGFAATNPIVGAIFKVVESIGSIVIHAVQGLAPGSMTIAQFVSKAEHLSYVAVLTKIVKVVEKFKFAATKTDGKVDLEEILTEFSKSLNENEKTIIATIANKST